MNNTLHGDWKPLLAEMQIFDGEDIYNLQIGYIDIDYEIVSISHHEGEIYIRLWDEDENLVQGAWVSIFGDDRKRISPKLRQMCLDAAERVKKLTAFA